MRRIKYTLAGLVAFVMACSAAWASSDPSIVLGAEGELYSVRTGLYGQLFPGGKDTLPGNAVLALEITQTDGIQQRHLVNGTAGPDVDSLPFLLFEEASRTLFLVWERRVNQTHPILMLSGYSSNGTWFEPFEIVGNPFSPKTSPQFAVTQEDYEEQGPEGPIARHRTILHLVWGEEVNSGAIETFYSPVILENGTFFGKNSVFNLNHFEQAQAAASIAASVPSPELAQALRVQRGEDGRSVVVAFVSEVSGQLNTLEIDTLPMQLSLLADGARAHIIDLGAKLYPGKLKNLAGEARAHIIDLGRSFHPMVASSLALQAEAYLLSSGDSPGSNLKSLADGARAHIIDLGAKFSGKGLRTGASALVPSKVVEAQPEVDNAGGLAPQLLQIQVLSGRTAPEVGRGQIHMFASASGQNVLLAWIDGQRVLYRESVETGWSEVREIRLSVNLDLNSAIEILEQRVLNR